MSTASIIPMPSNNTTADNTKPAAPFVTTGSTPYEEVAPWPEPVDLRALLDQMRDTLRRHIIADHEVFSAATLWIVMTYLVDLFDIVALLVITAPEMRCGKSEFKRLIGRMVKRPVPADNMTAAVLFRCFDLWHPTLLVDEYDTFVKGNIELQGIFNAGHQRGGCVWRCVGEDLIPKPFDVFGAKVLAGIGRLPPTLTDRGIILPLRRKLPHEETLPQRAVPKAFFRDIQSKLERVGQDYADQIAAARPSLPGGLNHRAQDNWRPLFQIAAVVGGDWPARALSAALKLSRDKDEAKTLGVELLSDIQLVFDGRKADRISSSDLIAMLCTDDERPWAAFNKGYPITPAQVAKRLREFGILSKTIRVNGTTLKGYFLSQFEDAFARYVFADSTQGSPDVTPSPTKSAEHSAATAPLRPAESDVACYASEGTPCEGVAGRTEAGATTGAADAGGDALAETRNDGVTRSASPDGASDVVTLEPGGEEVPPRTYEQELALTEFTAMLVQKKLDACVGDDGTIGAAGATKVWPEGLPFEDLAERVKGRLRHGDPRLRSVTSRQVCRQLVERGDLLLIDGILRRPQDEDLLP